MVLQKVYGVVRDLDIPLDVAPTEQEQEEFDILLEGSEHGWFDSVGRIITPATTSTSLEDNNSGDGDDSPPVVVYEERPAKLHYRKWLPKDNKTNKPIPPKAVVVFMHGILGHIQNAWDIEYPDKDGDKDGDKDDNNDGQKSRPRRRRRLNSALLCDVFVKREGYALYGFDMYGHGFSEGTRFLIPQSTTITTTNTNTNAAKDADADAGAPETKEETTTTTTTTTTKTISGYEINKQDYIHFVTHVVAKEHPTNVPIFIMGESYGGCLTLHVAKYFQDLSAEQRPSNLCLAPIVICPAIIGDLPPYPVYALLRYVLAPYFPTRTPFFMPNTLPPERIWRDERVLQRHANGREKESFLEGGGRPFRLGTALGLVLALEDVRTQVIPHLSTPFCIVHGEQDAGVPIEGSELLYTQSQTPDDEKAFLRLPDAYHDLLGDPDAERVVDFCCEWIQKRTTITQQQPQAQQQQQQSSS